MQIEISGNIMFYLLASMASSDYKFLQAEDISEKEAHRWHCCFGNLNHNGLKMLSLKKMVIGFPYLQLTKKIGTTYLTGK